VSPGSFSLQSIGEDTTVALEELMTIMQWVRLCIAYIAAADALHASGGSVLCGKLVPASK